MSDSFGVIYTVLKLTVDKTFFIFKSIFLLRDLFFACRQNFNLVKNI